MKYEFIELGPTPCNEECIPVNSDWNYRPAMIFECDTYVKQLQRVFSDLKDNNHFIMKRFPHDFGDYYEVVITFADDESGKYAFQVDEEVGIKCSEWDSVSLTLLEEYYNGKVEDQAVQHFRKRSRSARRNVQQLEKVMV